MARVIWSIRAQRDLAKIDDYYHERNPDVAVQIGLAAIGAAQFLLSNPLAGPLVERTKFHKWIVRTTPYIVFYRPDGSDIRIVRVRHMAEDWKPAE